MVRPLRDLRRADPPAEAVVLVPERPFSASRCSVFSDPYLGSSTWLSGLTVRHIWLSFCFCSPGLSLFAISELIERAILTFGRWQKFPTGLKAKQLQFRSDRKSQKRIFIWFGISLTFYFAYFALICFFRR